MKKLYFSVALFFILFSLSACSGGPEPDTTQDSIIDTSPAEVASKTEEEPMSFDERVGILKKMIGEPTDYSFIETVMTGYTPVDEGNNTFIFLASEVDKKDLSSIEVKFNTEKTVIEQIDAHWAKDGEVPKNEVFK